MSKKKVHNRLSTVFNVAYLIIALVLIIVLLVMRCIEWLNPHVFSFSDDPRIQDMIPSIISYFFYLMVLIYCLLYKRTKVNWFGAATLTLCFISAVLNDWVDPKYSFYFATIIFGALTIQLICLLWKHPIQINEWNKSIGFACLLAAVAIFALLCGRYDWPEPIMEILTKVGLFIYAAVFCFVGWRAVCLWNKVQYSWRYLFAFLLWMVCDFTIIICMMLPNNSYFESGTRLTSLITMGDKPVWVGVIQWLAWRPALLLISTFEKPTFDFLKIKVISS